MQKTSILILLMLAAFCGQEAFAQQYNWIKGGGSTVPYNPFLLGALNGEEVRYICSDEAKNVYVLCVVADTSVVVDHYRSTDKHPNHHRLLLASYACSGSLRWAQTIECDSNMTSHGLQYYKGNLYVAGAFLGRNRYFNNVPVTGNDSQRTFLARVQAATGNTVWIRFAGPKALHNGYYDMQARAGALTIDPKGLINRFVYLNSGVSIGSTVTPSTNTYDLKYDSSGNLVGTLRLDIDTAYTFGRQENHTNARISSSGRIYAVLRKEMSNLRGSAVCAFSASGSLLWKDTVAYESTGFASALNRIYYDGSNGLYVSGLGANGKFYFGGKQITNTLRASGSLATIAKLDTNGQTKWIYVNENYSPNAIAPNDIVRMPDGKLMAAYRVEGLTRNGPVTYNAPGSFSHPFFTIIDTTGKLSKFGGFYTTGYTIPGLITFQPLGYFSTSTIDEAGNLYLGGSNRDTVRAPNQVFYKSRGGVSDFFVAKYGYSCNCVLPDVSFNNQTGVNKTVSFTHIGTKPVDSVSWDFGDGATSKQMNPSHTYTDPNKASFTVCLTVYTSCGVKTTCRQISPNATGLENSVAGAGVRIYPNPASTYLVVEGAAGHVARLVNGMGQTVRTIRIEDERHMVDIRVLAAGTYLLQLNDSAGSVIRTGMVVKE